MSPLAASQRLRRLLSIVPWVAAHDGPSIDEVCVRFDIDREELLADLDVVFMVGIHPFTPDTLMDVVVEDDRVWIHYADFFSRPLRLTPDQALGLVAAGSSLLDIPGADPEGPLARGLAKLAAAIGVDPDDTIEVTLGEAPLETLELLQQAARDRHQVELDYYTFSRDERTHRVVEPWRVYADAGEWYVAGWCHLAGGERIFRVDRIHDAVVLEDTFEAPDEPPELGVYSPQKSDPRVTLELDPEARWVAEQYPCEDVKDLGDGRTRVRLAVSGVPWLERLLLRLGPHATVVRSTGGLDAAQTGASAAARVLTRYQG